MGIIYLEKTMSTNEYIKENAASFSHLDAVYTLCQTNGRGRLGRTWSANGGIALSVFVNHTEKPMLIPIYAAVALYNTLIKSGIKNLGIKWPNDILAGGKKLCGILCEGINGGVIIGVGINNKQTEESFIKEGLPYATSVRILGYRGLNEGEFVKLYLEELENAFNLTSDKLISLFSDACVNIGKQVKVIKNGQEIIAKAIKVSSQGGLMVEIDGKIETVISGEVSVRGIYGYCD